MSYKRCCVPGCSSTEESQNVLHEFPNPAKDLDRFMNWINSIGGDILKFNNEFIYKNRRICRMHFEIKYHCRNNRLSKIAVPTINMPCLNTTTLREEQNLLEDMPSSHSSDLTFANSTKRGPLRQTQNLPINVNVLNSKVSMQCDLSHDKENIDLNTTTLREEQNLLEDMPSSHSSDLTFANSTKRGPLRQTQNLPINVNVLNSKVSMQCDLSHDKENIDLNTTTLREEQNLLEDMPSSHSSDLTFANSTKRGPSRQTQNLPINVNVLNSKVSMQCDLSHDKENIASSSKFTMDNKSASGPKDKISRNQQRASSSKCTLDNKSTTGPKDKISRNQHRVDTKKKNYTVRMKKRYVKMTKPEQDLYKKLLSVKRKLFRYKNKLSNQATQIKLAKNIISNPAFLKVMENLPASAKILFMMQFCQQGKKAKGRRFDLKEKIMSLSLMKQSPKAYRFLRNFLILPARQTLNKLITRANIQPGINKKIFLQLKAKSADMTPNEKLCILMFDEMSLKANVTYNERKDSISGFVTNGKKTQPIFANHAQVFMIRGLHKNYKQPVSYTFSSGATKGPELAQQVKDIIISLQEAGFKVVTTVCDQGTNNRQAIRYLMDETRGDRLRLGLTPKDNVFMVNGEEIVPLYDPPHLLKGIRNNLLTKNLEYEMNGDIKVAKWQHLELLHQENPGYKGIRLIPKLTDNHIVPQKIGKMKVKYASQVFSATVASNMGYLADKNILPEECKDTADILFFFDHLFDSLNGSFTTKKRYAKPLLGPVTPTSVHWKKWSEGKKVLKSMKFINRSGKKEFVPTLNSWLWTLEGIQVLLKNLEKNYNITSVWMRHMNQDPIENFFGAIRSHGCRNTNPTPERFESAFTTLLVNSLTSVYSPGGNCEQDLGEALITLIDEDCKANDNSTCEMNMDDILNIELESIQMEKSNPKILAPLQYVSGYFIKKTKNIYKSCETCKNTLEASEETEYIKYREYANRRWLCSPSNSVVTIISNIQDIAISLLKKKFQIKNLKQYIITVVYTLVDFKQITICNHHKENLIKFLINAVCRFFIYNYCKTINKILCGKKEIDDVSDKYQIMAKNEYQKSLRFKKK